MSEKEKKIARAIVKAMNHIPDEKKEFFIGYAQGVADAKKKIEKTEEDKPA